VPYDKISLKCIKYKIITDILLFLNGLLTVHRDIIKVLFANLMHNFFIKSIVFVSMF